MNSLKDKLMNAQADILSIDIRREQKYTYVFNDIDEIIDVPASYNGSIGEYTMDDLFTASNGYSGLAQLEYKKVKEIYSRPVNIVRCNFGVSFANNKQNCFFFSASLGPFAANEWHIYEGVYLVGNYFERADFESIGKIVDKTLDHIEKVFSIEIDERERKVMTERVRAHTKGR